MEHPLRTILKAFGIVFLAGIGLYELPAIAAGLDTMEWNLVLVFSVLLVLLMLTQVYTSSVMLSRNRAIK